MSQLQSRHGGSKKDDAYSEMPSFDFGATPNEAKKVTPPAAKPPAPKSVTTVRKRHKTAVKRSTVAGSRTDDDDEILTIGGVLAVAFQTFQLLSTICMILVAVGCTAGILKVEVTLDLSFASNVGTSPTVDMATPAHEQIIDSGYVGQAPPIQLAPADTPKSVGTSAAAPVAQKSVKAVEVPKGSKIVWVYIADHHCDRPVDELLEVIRPLQRLGISSLKDHSSEFTIRVINNETISTYLDTYAVTALNSVASHWSAVPSAIRVHVGMVSILLQHGGILLDSYVTSFKSLEPYWTAFTDNPSVEMTVIKTSPAVSYFDSWLMAVNPNSDKTVIKAYFDALIQSLPEMKGSQFFAEASMQKVRSTVMEQHSAKINVQLAACCHKPATWTDNEQQSPHLVGTCNKWNGKSGPTGWDTFCFDGKDERVMWFGGKDGGLTMGQFSSTSLVGFSVFKMVMAVGDLGGKAYTYMEGFQCT